MYTENSSQLGNLFELTFGTHDVLYTDLLKGVKEFSRQHMLLQRLVDSIAKFRAVSAMDKELFGFQGQLSQGRLHYARYKT